MVEGCRQKSQISELCHPNAQISVNMSAEVAKPAISESCDYALNDGAVSWGAWTIRGDFIFSMWRCGGVKLF